MIPSYIPCKPLFELGRMSFRNFNPEIEVNWYSDYTIITAVALLIQSKKAELYVVDTKMFN